MSEYILENGLDLVTPIGTFCVFDGQTKIPFSVTKNNYDIPYDIYNADTDSVSDAFHTETNYALVIDVGHLRTETTYKVVFSCGHLKYRASDEHTVALTATVNGWSVGIGAYDPNDMVNDASKLTGYAVEESGDGTGFTFQLLDRSIDKIVFLVAWIENKGLEKAVYEDAIGFWLT